MSESQSDKDDTLLMMEACEAINKLSPRKYLEIRLWIVMRPKKENWEALMKS